MRNVSCITRVLICIWPWIVVACDRERVSREISEPPLRAGSPTATIEVQYLDDRPALNADGTKLVFLSGRGSSPESSILKVFKVDWPEGLSPTQPVRLISEDFGKERQACISPNGASVGVIASSGGEDVLLLAAFDGSRTVKKISTSPDRIEDLVGCAFSPDSKLIAWISRSKKATTSVLNIFDIESSEIPLEVKVDSDGKSFIRNLVWLKNQNALSLLITTAEPGSGLIRLKKIDLEISNQGIVPNVVSLYEDSSLAYEVGLAVGANRLLFARRLNQSNGKYVKHAGNFKFEPTQQTMVNSEPGSLDLTMLTGTIAPVFFDELPGSEVLGLGVSADDSFAIMLERNAWRCEGESNLRYGTSFVQAAVDLSSFKRFLPRYQGVNNSWQIANEYCDGATGNQESIYIDDRITSFHLNSGATAEKYRVLYVSAFSKAYDKQCRHLIGDPEIYGIEANNSEKKIYPVSSNAAKYESEARTDGEKPCSG